MPDKLFINEVIAKNEKLVKQFGYHWTHYLKPGYFLIHLVPVGIAALLGLALLPFTGTLVQTVPIIGFAVIAGLIFEVLVWRYITSDVRIITNKRVIIKTGFFNRKTDEMRLNAIEEIEFKQGLIQRLLRVGNLIITGRGGGSTLKLHCTGQPMRVKNAIENLEWV